MYACTLPRQKSRQTNYISWARQRLRSSWLGGICVRHCDVRHNCIALFSRRESLPNNQVNTKTKWNTMELVQKWNELSDFDLWTFVGTACLEALCQQCLPLKLCLTSLLQCPMHGIRCHTCYIIWNHNLLVSLASLVSYRFLWNPGMPPEQIWQKRRAVQCVKCETFHSVFQNISTCLDRFRQATNAVNSILYLTWAACYSMQQNNPFKGHLLTWLSWLTVFDFNRFCQGALHVFKPWNRTKQPSSQRKIGLLLKQILLYLSWFSFLTESWLMISSISSSVAEALLCQHEEWHCVVFVQRTSHATRAHARGHPSASPSLSKIRDIKKNQKKHIKIKNDKKQSARDSERVPLQPFHLLLRRLLPPSCQVSEQKRSHISHSRITGRPLLLGCIDRLTKHLLQVQSQNTLFLKALGLESIPLWKHPMHKEERKYFQRPTVFGMLLTSCKCYQGTKQPPCNSCCKSPFPQTICSRSKSMAMPTSGTWFSRLSLPFQNLPS